MEFTEEQINIFCSVITVPEIIEYINTHQSEYEEYINTKTTMKSDNN